MKYIVVTGANGGIGKATVKKLLADGYFVVGLDLKDTDLKDSNYAHVCCDITNNQSIENAVKEISKITTSIYAIMNIAGIFMFESIVEGSEEDLRKIIDINFFGAYKVNKALLPLLSKDSRIIVFSSEVARYSPQPFNGYYSLSKIIVDKYADILRRELNYLKIKVIKVQSGAIKTNLLTGVNSQYEQIVKDTKFYKEPLTKLKKLMDDEINKQVDPAIVATKLSKIVKKNNPKILYKIKNSFKLRFLDSLPEKLQDWIYLKVIK